MSASEKQKLTCKMRRAQVAELRLCGASVVQMAKQFKVTEVTIYKDLAALDAALLSQPQMDTAARRELENQRLEMARLAIAKQVKAGHLGAVDRWVKISERTAKMNGIDAPQSVHIDGQMGLKEYVGISPDDWDDTSAEPDAETPAV